MALASNPGAHSPVELSLSPVYHYQFSSIAKVLDHIAPDNERRSALQKSIQNMCMPYFDSPISQQFWLLQTDTTPACKPHSPTLKDRTHVAVSNHVIAGNKPLSIGYDISLLNLSDPQSSWSLPLSVRRVAVDETMSECALEQLEELFTLPDLNFNNRPVVNTLDSKYGNARYLAPAHRHQQLINVVRLRAGMKVYKRDYCLLTGGAPKVYGEKYYLNSQSQYKTYRHPQTKQPYEVFQRSIFEWQADEFRELSAETAKGRKLTIKVWRYHDMMIRSKDGHNMKDKPFDLLAVRVCDAETGKPVFDREMFLAICGERKGSLSTQTGYRCFRHRYDIEHYIRFCKQSLLLEKYQTPEVEHFDNWLLILQLTSWLLYSASQEAHYHPRKWESYLPKNKSAEKAERLSLAQTRRAAEDLFLTFDPTPFKPTKCKKGKGRPKGFTLTPRTRYKVVKKRTHKAKSKHKKEQIE